MTAHTETTIQAAIQTAFQAMDEFADADVIINDWDVLDQSSANAPYALIENSDDFESRQDTQTPENKWYIPANIIVRWIDWKTSYDALRVLRDAVIAKINSDTVRAAGGLAGVNLRTIRNDGKQYYIYDPYASNPEESLPIFLAHRLILEVEEFA